MAGTLNSDQIVVGGTGTIYVAPVGTPLPTAVDSTLNSLFLSLGYTTPEGVKFKLDTQSKGVMGWQSFYELRRIIESRAAAASFGLMEFDAKTVPLAFGGGEVTEPTSGKFKYTPPTPETVDERSMIIDIEDGTRVFRIVIERGMVSNSVETDFMRTDASVLPIEFSALAAITDGTQPWFMLTNDTGFGLEEAGS